MSMTIEQQRAQREAVTEMQRRVRQVRRMVDVGINIVGATHNANLVAAGALRSCIECIDWMEAEARRRDEYIDERRTRYYPLSAESHCHLQRRLEVAQEALKPFARQADMIDQSDDGWLGANQQRSIYELGAVLRARDVLLEQKVWDRLPDEEKA